MEQVLGPSLPVDMSAPTVLSTPQSAGTRAECRRTTYEAGAQRSGFSASGTIGGAAFGGLVCAITGSTQKEARKLADANKREASAMGGTFTCEKDEGGAPTFCCVYCWEELAEYGSKACGHVFGCAKCVSKAEPRCPMCRADTDKFVKTQVLYNLGKKVFTSGLAGAPTPPEVRIVFTDPMASGKGKHTKYADIIDQYAADAISKAFEEAAKADINPFGCVADVAKQNPSLFWSVVMLDESSGFRDLTKTFVAAGMGRKRGSPKGQAGTGDTAPKATPKASKKPATKAPVATTEANKGTAKGKLTYPKAIVHVIKAHGLLSRAALSKELSALGLSNEAQVKTALKAQLKVDGIQNDSGSFRLGGSAYAQLQGDDAVAYEAVLKQAQAGRSDKAADKLAGQMRAEKQYAKNIKKAAASGFSVTM